MAQKRSREGGREIVDISTSDDDATLGELSAAAAALQQQGDWAQGFIMRIDDIVQAVTEFCQSQGLFCKARVRSSDQTRATIACKQQASGCPLRLTVKKATACMKHGSANMQTFKIGTCARMISPKPALPPSSDAVISPPGAADTVSEKCTECNELAVLSCGKGQHHFCPDCVGVLSKSQLGELDIFIQRRMQFLCPYDGSLLNGEKISDVLLASKAPIPKGPALSAEPMTAHDQAFASICHIVTPRCPKCDVPIVDFEACAALTCGRRLQLGDRVDISGGCGANLCAWCLMEVPPHESHHAHVRTCSMNPDEEGSVYPPHPHPAVWKAFMAVLARERVFNFVERIQGADKRDALYSAVRKDFPDLKLSKEWLASRHQWLILMMEMGTQDADIHRAHQCLHTLEQMGYKDDEVLRRAILICNYEIQSVIDVMRAHNHHEQARQ